MNRTTLALCPFISMLKSPILLLYLFGQLEDYCVLLSREDWSLDELLWSEWKGFNSLVTKHHATILFHVLSYVLRLYSLFFLLQLSNITVSFTVFGFNPNPIKSTVSCLIHKFLRTLNDQHDQTFAEKPVTHNLLHTCCHLNEIYFKQIKSVLV